ncbi:MAG: hypothetical protein AAGA54_26325 [Myxococcota bacterium]
MIHRASSPSFSKPHALGILIATLGACGEEPRDIDVDPSTSSASPTSAGGTAEPPDAKMRFDLGPRLGVFSNDTESLDMGFAECVEAVVTTEKAKIDLIVGLDLSGSVFGGGGAELANIGASMNALAEGIAGSGIDTQVHLLGYACEFENICVCVAPPLGREGVDTCNEADPDNIPLGTGFDSNPPGFRRYSLDITEDVLSWLVYEYDSYRDNLRSDALPVFLVFTDDDPEPRDFAEPILTADAFEEAMFELDPERFGTSDERRYIFNSVVGTTPDSFGPSFQQCDLADALGGEYQELSIRTGGFISSICSETPSQMFDLIANGLVGRLSCEIELEDVELAPGMNIDRNRVRLLYTPGSDGEQRSIEYVGAASDCTDTSINEFFLEDTTAILCPASCEAIQDDTEGKLALAFGCAAEIL